MSRFRFIVPALFAICALGAVVSAIASAFSYLVLGGWQSGPEKFTSKNLGAAVWAFAGTEVDCTNAKGIGTINLAGLGEYHTVFTVCGISKPAICKVKEPILVTGVHHLALNPVDALGVLFLTSKPGNTFFSLEFENNGGGECSLIGPQEVTGSVIGFLGGGNP